MAALAVLLAGCRPEEECWYTEYLEITGSVQIETERDLEAVAGRCVFVRGDLRFHDWNAADLGGLEGIVGVSGNVVITRAYALESTAGLESLEFIGGNLKIQEDPALTEVDFPRLNAVGGAVRVRYLAALETVPGIAEIGGDLEIRELAALRELDLDGVRYVGGSLKIHENPRLTAVDGSDDLFEVSGRLALEGNHALVRVTGFDGLDRIGGGVFISDAAPYGRDECEPVASEAGTAGGFTVSRTNGLERVAGFGRIVRLDYHEACPGQSLALEDNRALAKMAALPGLERASALVLEENPSLVGLPRWAELEVGSIRVTGQPTLRDLRLLSGLTATNAHIESNPDLVALDGLRLSNDAWRLVVEENPQLVRWGAVDAGEVVALSVRRNERLNDLSGLRSLQDVSDELNITENPSLPQTEAVEVSAHFEAPRGKKIGGNRGWLVPAECPWVEDGVCDEDPYFDVALCRAGTDTEDCEE